MRRSEIASATIEWPSAECAVNSRIFALAAIALLAVVAMKDTQPAFGNPPVPPAAPPTAGFSPVLPRPTGFRFRTFQQVATGDGSVVLVPIGSDGKLLSLQSPDFLGPDGKPVEIFRSVTTPNGTYLVVEEPIDRNTRIGPGMSELRPAASGEKGGHSGHSVPGGRSVVPVDTDQSAMGAIPTVAREPSKQTAPKGEEPFLGVWSSKDGTIQITFHKKQEFNASAASIVFSRADAQQVTLLGYTIEGKSNEVRFSGLRNAVARPTHDGAILLSCEVDLSGQTFIVTNERLERCEPILQHAEPGVGAASR